MYNPEKRKIVMQRSIKLGYCICNPKQGCPCDTFKDHNVCLCAGERLKDMPEEVQLTKFVENACQRAAGKPGNRRAQYQR